MFKFIWSWAASWWHKQINIEGAVINPLDSNKSSVYKSKSFKEIFRFEKLSGTLTLGCLPSTKTAKQFSSKSWRRLASSFPVSHKGISMETQSEIYWHKQAILLEALTFSPAKLVLTCSDALIMQIEF